MMLRKTYGLVTLIVACLIVLAAPEPTRAVTKDVAKQSLDLAKQEYDATLKWYDSTDIKYQPLSRAIGELQKRYDAVSASMPEEDRANMVLFLFTANSNRIAAKDALEAAEAQLDDAAAEYGMANTAYMMGQWDNSFNHSSTSGGFSSDAEISLATADEKIAEAVELILSIGVCLEEWEESCAVDAREYLCGR